MTSYTALMKAILLLPAVALLFLTGCGQSGGSQQPSTNAAQNVDKAEKVPYFGAMVKAEQNATSTADMATLKPAIDQFQVDKGRYPKDLNELVTEKYVSKIPEAPYGSRIDYDAATGTVKVVKQ